MGYAVLLSHLPHLLVKTPANLMVAYYKGTRAVQLSYCLEILGLFTQFAQ